ncbi:MAG: hypothetical protein QF464_08135 [Myxococcota bacterium]|jgi:hypothetical protein|nr:hypothetical protein [Myxococcota bacterium]
MHQRDENMAPDSDFEPGSLRHLVVGNTGRSLDDRRTPFRVVELRPATGQWVLEITAFEDTGALWVLPVEQVVSYQFALGSELRSDTTELQEAIDRFDRPLEIPFTPRPWPDLSSLEDQAGTAIGTIELDLTALRGSETAAAALQAFMTKRDLLDVEQGFADQYVQNPYSGERVQGHRIVLAELGRVPYVGRVVRDPATFTGRWSRERRRDHLLSRLAFVRALFRQAGHERVLLWRGLSTPGELLPPFNRTFVSTSFLREVAESLFRGAEETRVALLMRQWVPVERLFMTSMETEAMNRQYLEAEAVLFFDGGNRAF